MLSSVLSNVAHVASTKMCYSVVKDGYTANKMAENVNDTMSIAVYTTLPVPPISANFVPLPSLSCSCLFLPCSCSNDPYEVGVSDVRFAIRLHSHPFQKPLAGLHQELTQGKRSKACELIHSLVRMG